MACECPAPLVVPDSGPPLNAQTCCQLPCLQTMLTEDDMRLYGTIQFVLSTIGVLLAGFLVATWGIFKDKKPQYIIFWLSVCSFNVSLSFFVMSLTEDFNLTNNLCKDNVTPREVGNGFFSVAVFQGIWLIYFGMALCAWWAVQAVDLFRKLVLGTRNTDGSKFKYHCFCWICPALSLVGLLAGKAIGFKAPTPWALVVGETFVEWVAFYAFIAGCFVVGVVVMIPVMINIFQHARNQTRFNKFQGSNERRSMYSLYRTPLLFVIMFIFVWLNIFTFRAIITANEDEYEEAGQAWVQCLLVNDFFNVSDPANNPAADISFIAPFIDEDQVGCGITQPGGVNKAGLFITFFVIQIQSILLFLVFGPNKKNFELWGDKLGCDCCGLIDTRWNSSNGASHTLTKTDSIVVGAPHGHPYASTAYSSSNSSYQPSMRGGYIPNGLNGGPVSPPSSQSYAQMYMQDPRLFASMSQRDQRERHPSI